MRVQTQRAMSAMRLHHSLATASAFIPSSYSASTFTPGGCVVSRRHLCAARRGNLPGKAGSGKVIAMAAVDLKFIRQNVETIRANIEHRKVSADVDKVVALYDELVELQQETDSVRAQRNANADVMKSKAAKMSKDERAVYIEQGKALKAQLVDLEERLNALEQNLTKESTAIPNLTHPDVPVGDESKAAVLKMVNEPRAFGNSPVYSHLDILQMNDWVDFENAARVVGNKFYYLKNDAALLELALVQWAMVTARRNGFTVMNSPDVARESVIEGCGFQPRGESSQIYSIEGSDLCLIGTAEIVLGGYYADQILNEKDLPIKVAAFSHCFRREVGSAGQLTKGLYRVHQFSKVELFVISHPDHSDSLHEELMALERNMYEELGLHFKILDMPTEDLGNPAYRKFDIEAWMPGRNSYGEISSASNCTDYQARRLAIRYKDAEKSSNQYVHTLNATACAVPRMIISILETHQQPDGSVLIPEPLRPYLGGLDKIGGGDAAAAYISEMAPNVESADAVTASSKK